MTKLFLVVALAILFNPVVALAYDYFSTDLQIYQDLTFGNKTYGPGAYKDSVEIRRKAEGCFFEVRSGANYTLEYSKQVPCQDTLFGPKAFNLSRSESGLAFDITGTQLYDSKRVSSYTQNNVTCTTKSNGSSCLGISDNLIIVRDVQSMYNFNFLDSSGRSMGTSQYSYRGQTSETVKGVCRCL